MINKQNYWAFLIIGGLILAGVGLWLSEAVFLDNRAKISESTFDIIQTLCTGAMVFGGVAIVAGFLVGRSTQWRKK